MKYVWGQSDEHPFQAQKKKQNEEQNEDEKHDDDSDCSVLMLSKTCWQKKNCLHFVENEEKEAGPPPETILVLFRLKSEWFLQWPLPLVGFFWIHQGASVVQWKIAPMASLSCWAFRANRICRQIWYR